MKLDDLKLFVNVVEQGSFAAAARALDMPAATLTRRIQQLERDLDVQLLVRNARGLSLTNAGQNIWSKSQQKIRALEALSSELHDDLHEMAGKITIAAPVSFTNNVLAPMFFEFMKQNPQIQLELLAEEVGSSNSLSFHEDSIDIAFRFGEQKDSRLVARRLQGLKIILLAHADYLKAHGYPKEPADLKDHSMLAIRKYDQLQLVNQQSELIDIALKPRMFSSDGAMPLNAAMAGLGIVGMPESVALQEIAQGNLCRVLPEWESPEYDMFLVYASREYLPKRVRAMIDFIFECWAQRAI
ncbi:LysR family transcriptional regulator [Pelagibaculum spongiae]|uniref:LysR family transcriptional regulator n=1 Tax=Pelagibaculum spongiae TaxID=2080658 RepID=A0A2V1GWQ9_9GAMM|nr:LysR family transcriptional regulator [Pelagibaculum spongiae]PVZ63868.1 LysR family transcriptional regulator [Pelagibaculum spongiae]